MRCYKCGVDLKEKKKCPVCGMKFGEEQIYFLFPLKKEEVEAFYKEEIVEQEQYKNLWINVRDELSFHGAKKKDYEAAAYRLKRVAEQGDVNIQYELARLYDSYLMNIQLEEAVYWYTKAAEQGHVKAQERLAFMYVDGFCMRKNTKRAMYWFEKAAEHGEPTSQTMLGILYEDKSDDKAIYWYTKAAEQGEETALINLGRVYYYGVFGEKDYEKAAYWLEKSAKTGNRLAASLLRSALNKLSGEKTKEYE